ncbi:gp102L [Rabbit fibroma virus]|uniref:Gp102L n=1 Tax=Rabbit fibroma virus (strain Kasza) TaxID=10272 RepID=Q9Q8X6_RFVKA|nr:IMV membrane protein [Rabbit fibroma virus]AAF17985.1 gp102L [Rabbit fibroma virus]
MISELLLLIICVVIVGFIVYGIYTKKKTTQHVPPSSEQYEKMENLKTGYVDKLKSAHLKSFYKLFSSN